MSFIPDERLFEQWKSAPISVLELCYLCVILLSEIFVVVPVLLFNCFFFRVKQKENNKDKQLINKDPYVSVIRLLDVHKPLTTDKVPSTSENESDNTKKRKQGEVLSTTSSVEEKIAKPEVIHNLSSKNETYTNDEGTHKRKHLAPIVSQSLKSVPVFSSLSDETSDDSSSSKLFKKPHRLSSRSSTHQRKSTTHGQSQLADMTPLTKEHKKKLVEGLPKLKSFKIVDDRKDDNKKSSLPLWPVSDDLEMLRTTDATHLKPSDWIIQGLESDDLDLLLLSDFDKLDLFDQENERLSWQSIKQPGHDKLPTTKKIPKLSTAARTRSKKSFEKPRKKPMRSRYLPSKATNVHLFKPTKFN